MKVQTFMGGVAVLFIGGVLAKVLGAIFRIPLTWILGAEGLGIYQLIYPVFALLIVLSSSGMPTAISKMTAKRMQNNDIIGAKSVLRVSLVTLGIIGLIFSILLISCASALANLQGNSLSMLGYIGIAPAVFFVSILSAYRGYFQGCSNMYPTAFSQIIEQGGKLIFGLLFSYLLIGYGVEYGTLGAILGVTLSEILSVIVLWLIYLKDNKKKYNYSQKYLHNTPKPESKKTIFIELIKTSLPIVLSSITLPLLVMLDSMLVVNLLLNAGFDNIEATKMWGIESGVVNSLINMPIVLSLAVAISIVPVVANLKKGEQANEKINQAIVLVVLFCLPIMTAFLIMPDILMQFLYSESLGGVNYTSLASSLLISSSPVILLGAILQVQNSSLQGLGYGKITMLNMFIAGIAKIILTICLVALPNINIFGCVISNLAFYLLAFSLNALFMRYKFGFRFNFKSIVPSIAGVLGVALVLLNFSLLKISIYIMLPLALVSAFLVYLFALWAFGTRFDQLTKYRLKRMKKFNIE